MRILLAVLVLVLTAGTAIGGNGDSPLARNTLRGLQNVCVVIEHFDEKAQKAGFDTAQFQTDVELKLRLAGVKVVECTGGSTEQIVNTADLDVMVGLMPLEAAPGAFIYSSTVSLSQVVHLARTGELYYGADTWAVVAFGRGGVADVRGVVKDQVDKFVNAWLSVNPKK